MSVKRKSRAKKKEESVTVKEEKKPIKSKKTKTKKTTGTKAPKSTSTKTSKSKPKTTKKSTKVIHPEVNIGTAGHVDEGKSTLIQSLTGKFPDNHSEEIKRGITIRLGYADCDIKECPKCSEPDKWTVEDVCPHCGSKTKLNRRISFVDAPGHEILMQVMLSGAAIMDGVILVVGANKKVPQPQTREHLAAITALGIKNVIVVQNKVELVSVEQARENYKQIKNFLKGTLAENAPIIPMSAIHGINKDLLLSAIQNFIPTPKHDAKAPLRMFAARSFDINTPGTTAKNLKGGVFGGSITTGKVKVGETVRILPGLKKKEGKTTLRIPVDTKVLSIRVGESGDSKDATPGGLVAIQTEIDPSMTRSDNLSGSILTTPETPVEVVDELHLKYTLFDSVVGSDTNEAVKPLAKKEPLLLTVGTATVTGTITQLKKSIADVKLTSVIAMDPSVKVAISRLIHKRWRLIGFADIVEDEG